MVMLLTLYQFHYHLQVNIKDIQLPQMQTMYINLNLILICLICTCLQVKILPSKNTTKKQVYLKKRNFLLTNSEKSFVLGRKEKNKNKETASTDKTTENETKYQSSPEDTYDNTMGEPEQDYEPIDI